MSVVDLVEREQREIAGLLAHLVALLTNANALLLDEPRTQLERVISSHVEVEEELVHPIAQLAAGNAEVVADHQVEHRALERLSALLCGLDASSPDFADVLHELATAAERHAAHAERVLYVHLDTTHAAGDLAERYRAVRRNTYEDGLLPQVLAYVLAADACCLDVGSHRGRVLRELERCAPHGRHLAYEPIPELAQDLRDHFPNVDVREAVLSDTEGETTFAHVTSAPAYSGMRARPSSVRGVPDHVRRQDVETLVVRTERMDDALPKRWAPALVKIDVEGAESLVVAGGLETLARYRPVVVFEHMGHSPAYDADSAQLWEMLVVQAGLRVYDFDGRGPYSLEAFVESAERLLNTNYLARP